MGLSRPKEHRSDIQQIRRNIVMADKHFPELSPTNSIIELIVAPYFDKLSRWKFDENGFLGYTNGPHPSRILVDMRGDNESDIVVGHQCLSEGWTTWWYELADPTSIDRIRDKLEEII
jgi:hypothetical protein